MNTDELAQLGITRDLILDKLVDRICGEFDGNEPFLGGLQEEVRRAVTARIDEKLEAAVKAHIEPKVSELIDGVCLQETNQWGEKRGQSLTFIEYLVQRADAYIREPVDYRGRTKAEESSSFWKAHTTRLGYMIHEHLQYQISTAMKQALQVADASVRKSLQDAVTIAIENIKVSVNTKIE